MAERPESPDPTSLTTQALWREVQHLKELFETRISGMEKAIEVAHDDLVRVPTETQKQVGNLRDLHDEKFAGVQKQFEDRDKRTDLALQAAKELVVQQNISAAQSAAKQEASFSKQIDAQGVLLQTTAGALDDKVDDIKDRLTRIEGKGEGVSASWGWLVGAVGLLGGLITIFFALSK
jgi:phage shock protein A